MLEALQDEAVVKEFKQRLTKMPAEANVTYYSYLSARFIGKLLSAAKGNNSKFWMYFAPRIKEFPVLEVLFAQYSCANDPQNMQAGIRIWLKRLLKYLPVTIKDIPTEMEGHELADLLEKAYPLLRYLDETRFLDKANDNPQDAYACLKQILIPAGQLSSLSVTECSEVQEAAAA